MNQESSDIAATRRFRSAEAQEELRQLTDASVEIAASIAAAVFRDGLSTDPKVCADIALAASTIAAAVICVTRNHIQNKAI